MQPQFVSSDVTVSIPLTPLKPNPIGSMGRTVYLPTTFTIKNQPSMNGNISVLWIQWVWASCFQPGASMVVQCDCFSATIRSTGTGNVPGQTRKKGLYRTRPY